MSVPATGSMGGGEQIDAIRGKGAHQVWDSVPVSDITQTIYDFKKSDVSSFFKQEIYSSQDMD